jgi:hypothetical protein
LCNTVIGIIDKKAGLLMLDIKGFFKKGGMKWLFKSKPITFTSFPVGPYRLDMEISGLSGLHELSIIEYRAVWDTVDGNIALQTTEAPEGFGINIFLTSHAIRDFFPLR